MSRAAHTLHDGASMSALELFSLRSPGAAPSLPAMRLASPETDGRSESASTAGTLRRAGAEVIVNIKDVHQ